MDEHAAAAERRRMVESGQPQRDLAAELVKAALTGEEEPPTWNTAELQRDFEVVGFAAPFVVVRRRADGVKGTLEFTHSPRIYFRWEEHKP